MGTHMGAATRGQRQGSEPEAREALATGRANHRNRDRGRGQECVLKVRSDDWQQQAEDAQDAAVSGQSGARRQAGKARCGGECSPRVTTGLPPSRQGPRGRPALPPITHPSLLTPRQTPPHLMYSAPALIYTHCLIQSVISSSQWLQTHSYIDAFQTPNSSPADIPSSEFQTWDHQHPQTLPTSLTDIMHRTAAKA